MAETGSRAIAVQLTDHPSQAGRFEIVELGLGALGLVVSAIAVVLVYLTLRANMRSLDQAVNGNRIALEAQRPWVSLDKFLIASQSSPDVVDLGVQVINTGQTAAHHLSIRAAWSDDESHALELSKQPETIAGDLGGGQTALVMASGIQMAAIASNALRLRVRIDYNWIEGAGGPFCSDVVYRLSRHEGPEGTILRWTVLGEPAKA